MTWERVSVQRTLKEVSLRAMGQTKGAMKTERGMGSRKMRELRRAVHGFVQK